MPTIKPLRYARQQLLLRSNDPNDGAGARVEYSNVNYGAGPSHVVDGYFDLLGLGPRLHEPTAWFNSTTRLIALERLRLIAGGPVRIPDAATSGGRQMPVWKTGVALLIEVRRALVASSPSLALPEILAFALPFLLVVPVLLPLFFDLAIAIAVLFFVFPNRVLSATMAAFVLIRIGVDRCGQEHHSNGSAGYRDPRFVLGHFK